MLLQEWQAASRRSKAKGAGARRSELTAEEAFHDVRDFWQRLDADSRHQLLRVPVQGLLTRTSQSGAWCWTSGSRGSSYWSGRVQAQEDVRVECQASLSIHQAPCESRLQGQPPGPSWCACLSRSCSHRVLAPSGCTPPCTLCTRRHLRGPQLWRWCSVQLAAVGGTCMSDLAWSTEANA